MFINTYKKGISTSLNKMPCLTQLFDASCMCNNASLTINSNLVGHSSIVVNGQPTEGILIT